jgi:hypothetical protein
VGSDREERAARPKYRRDKGLLDERIVAFVARPQRGTAWLTIRELAAHTRLRRYPLVASVSVCWGALAGALRR